MPRSSRGMTEKCTNLPVATSCAWYKSPARTPASPGIGVGYASTTLTAPPITAGRLFATRLRAEPQNACPGPEPDRTARSVCPDPGSARIVAGLLRGSDPGPAAAVRSAGGRGIDHLAD